jgi:hypothetical protein
MTETEMASRRRHYNLLLRELVKSQETEPGGIERQGTIEVRLQGRCREAVLPRTCA